MLFVIRTAGIPSTGSPPPRGNRDAPARENGFNMAIAIQPTYSNLRMPPQDLVAEQSVLGALMIDGKALDVVSDILSSDDFYHQRHRMIYDAMLDRYQKNEPIDIVSLSSRLWE